jgi:GTP-binding protein Era
MSEASHRAGVVALIGLPNAGKSSLLNRLVGEKLAIVSARPQTTRGRVLGIRTLPGAQLLFLDTPGLHEGTKPLHQAMHDAVRTATQDCDVALLVIDPERGLGPEHQQTRGRLAERGVPVVLVGSKSDLPAAAASPWPPPLEPAPAAALRVSARTGAGIEALLAAIPPLLPLAPAYYPEDELTDRPLRFLAAELVREAAFEALQQELPYAMAVEVTAFDESRPALVRIDADLLVERASQKRIVVGTGGEMVKRIGTRARLEIERLLETRVHLALRVKVEPQWSRLRQRIEALGYF